MDEEEGDEQPRDDEMDRTRRLASAEQVEQPRRGGVDPRRHGEPGRDHQRQQDKDDADVTEFLEDVVARRRRARRKARSEEHTSELQSLMRISYAVFCLKKKKQESANTSTQ